MKKHVYSFMLLALFVLAGIGASAQTGITRATALPMVVGSVGQFTGADASTGGNGATTWAWTVWDVADDAEAYTASGGTGTTNGTEFRFVTSLIDYAAPASTDANNVFIQWLAAPTGTFAVQCIASNAECSTVRRFYVSVFDFEVTVEICDNTGSDYAADNAEDNSWSGLVVGNDVNSVNPFEGTAISDPHGDYVNIPSGGTNKYTSTYFNVTITLDGNPSGFDFEDIKWRLEYSLPSAANMSIYQVVAMDTGAEFDAEGSGTTTVGGATGDAVYAVPAKNWIYFSEKGAGAGGGDDASFTYQFEVRTHNNLGDADMVYDVRVDRASLEFDTAAGTAYNDGAKMATANGTGDPVLADEDSFVKTIYMSPATDVIGITQ